MNDNNSNSYNFNIAMPIMTTFYMVWGHHERAFVGGRATSPNIYKMADGGHIEFRKIPKYFRTIDEDFLHTICCKHATQITARRFQFAM